MSDDLVNRLLAALTDDLRRPKYRGNPNPLAGHCYVASEAAYHLLGGSARGWGPQFIRHEGDTHWFLKNRNTGEVLDLTKSQFRTPVPYEQARGRGFLTKAPSARAQKVIESVRKSCSGAARRESPT